MFWIEEAGWQVEVIANDVPNVVSFLLTAVLQRWYIVRAYVPINNLPTAAPVGQEIGNEPKVVEVILMGNLNIRLQEPCDAREEELVTVVVECGLEDMTAHFMPRRSYK